MITPRDNEGYDPMDDEDKLYEEAVEEDHFEAFDCHMTLSKAGKPLGCGMAGSEECDFECPFRRMYGW